MGVCIHNMYMYTYNTHMYKFYILYMKILMYFLPQLSYTTIEKVFDICTRYMLMVPITAQERIATNQSAVKRCFQEMLKSKFSYKYKMNRSKIFLTHSLMKGSLRCYY